MDSTTLSLRQGAVPEFLSGGGEMGERIRNFDWSKTSIGPIESWPQSLRTCIRIMLTSRQPIWIGWGKDLIKLYNDPYKAIVGGKHPWALGTSASIVWKDIWKDIEPMLRTVMEKDEGTYVESQLLIMERNGYPEETYYTFSYTPIPGDDGGTAGMICANTDDTERIISERQLKTLTQLGKNLTDCKSNYEVIVKTVQTLQENPYDFPFVLFRTLADKKAILVHSTPLGNYSKIVSPEIDIESDHPISRILKKVYTSRKLQVFDGLKQLNALLPKGAWEIHPDKTIVVPILTASSKEPYAFLIVGMNPYRLMDEKYTSFFNLIGDQIATSFSNVHSFEEERKRAEALAEIDKAKTIFFSNISHEFRTPLTLLLGPIEDAINDKTTTTENKKRMDVAYRNALRMQKLVNTLLEFSRIESGRVEGRFSLVDLCSFTKDLVSVFRSAIEKAGMELKFECGEIHDNVYVDTDMWEKIVLNLVSNAFKYSKQGTITIHVTQAGNDAELKVSDTGIGIPQDQLDKIFERFHRVENVDGRSQEGTGIGLAMVKELVRLHSGTISVNSHPGVGSTFTVKIPVGKEHLPQEKIYTDAESFISKNSMAYVEEALKWIPGSDEQIQVSEGDQSSTNAIHRNGKVRILLADDNADMRDYVKRLLDNQMDVITAEDGEDAFNKLIQYQPELVLSDIMMPRLDGFGLLERIRKHEKFKNIPVIFLSARAGEEATVEGLNAGADDYLVKPFSSKELIATVTANIKISRSRLSAQRNLEALFQQAPIPIAIFYGPTYITRVVNDEALALWGKSKEEVMNRPVAEAFPEIAEQGIIALLDGVYETGTPFVAKEMHVVLFRNQKADQLYINFVYSPFRNEMGKIEGIIAAGIEVTDQVIARTKIEDIVKERTMQLNETNNSLQQSNNDLQQFAHVASHDMKEPLRKIRTFTGRLIDDPQTSFSDKGRMYIDKVNSSVDRMFNMIEGVLNYSTINAMEQVMEKVDLNKIIENIKTDLELPIANKSASIYYNNLPVIEGASVLLYQMFYNLINNSLKFSIEGKPVEINISSSLKKEDEMTEIRIRDNGIGFEQEFAEKIFNSFTRLNPKDRFEGTGLGLSLCLRIAQRHGGSISAVSEPGKGAEFILLLPLKQLKKQL